MIDVIILNTTVVSNDLGLPMTSMPVCSASRAHLHSLWVVSLLWLFPIICFLYSPHSLQVRQFWTDLNIRPKLQF